MEKMRRAFSPLYEEQMLYDKTIQKMLDTQSEMGSTGASVLKILRNADAAVGLVNYTAEPGGKPAGGFTPECLPMQP
jgi:hypothetical protein